MAAPLAHELFSHFKHLVYLLALSCSPRGIVPSIFRQSGFTLLRRCTRRFSHIMCCFSVTSRLTPIWLAWFPRISRSAFVIPVHWQNDWTASLSVAISTGSISSIDIPYSLALRKLVKARTDLVGEEIPTVTYFDWSHLSIPSSISVLIVADVIANDGRGWFWYLLVTERSAHSKSTPYV